MGYLSPPPAPAPVVVYKDVGGLVSEYQAQTEIYRREGREVRLHECRSACTMALSLPNVCVYPDSLVKFHLAYNAIDHQTDAGVSAELFNYYPAAVRERLGYLTRQYRVLNGNELISLGIRNCNGSDRTMIASAGRSRRAAQTLASAAPAPDPLGDLAQKVRGAVSQAFADPAAPPQGPIRLALAARDRLAATGAVDPMTTASIRANGAAPVEAPEPPRRPPSGAFTPRDAEAQTRPEEPAVAAAPAPIIPGGQPILASGVFVPPLAAVATH
ncbi:hypothetical protein IY145_12385 [Methylosinus sp. H3A]|uniref:hypothetical protein n=1 Tax=Methylosinus sp. H3A TaxID=2785786 RepID=UPI0018C27510|nr:hypothetical protein [Methylosinus sp. H3A]MBG0810176.1 hypothetical protein [Methylosinus sp. H3A]